MSQINDRVPFQKLKQCVQTNPFTHKSWNNSKLIKNNFESRIQCRERKNAAPVMRKDVRSTSGKTRKWKECWEQKEREIEELRWDHNSTPENGETGASKKLTRRRQAKRASLVGCLFGWQTNSHTRESKWTAARGTGARQVALVVSTPVRVNKLAPLQVQRRDVFEFFARLFPGTVEMM